MKVILSKQKERHIYENYAEIDLDFRPVVHDQIILDNKYHVITKIIIKENTIIAVCSMADLEQPFQILV